MTGPSVLALDLSARKAGVCLPDGSAQIVTPPARHVGAGRLGWWHRTIVALVRDNTPDVVAVEGPSLHSKGAAGMIAAAEVRGVCRLAVSLTHPERDDPWVEVAPASIKRYATGKGNANKDVVKAECRKRLPWNGESDDEADAVWLWALTHAALDQPVVDVPKANQTAIAAVVKALDKAGLS